MKNKAVNAPIKFEKIVMVMINKEIHLFLSLQIGYGKLHNSDRNSAFTWHKIVQDNQRRFCPEFISEQRKIAVISKSKLSLRLLFNILLLIRLIRILIL